MVLNGALTDGVLFPKLSSELGIKLFGRIENTTVIVYYDWATIVGNNG
jgi:hypothetical protein